MRKLSTSKTESGLLITEKLKNKAINKNEEVSFKAFTILLISSPFNKPIKITPIKINNGNSNGSLMVDLKPNEANKIKAVNDIKNLNVISIKPIFILNTLRIESPPNSMDIKRKNI